MAERPMDDTFLDSAVGVTLCSPIDSELVAVDVPRMPDRLEAMVGGVPFG